MLEVQNAAKTRNTVSFVGSQTSSGIQCTNSLVLRLHYEDRDGSRTDHHETCMFVLKEWLAAIRLRRTVAVREYRLNDLQRPKPFLGFLRVVHIDKRNLRVRRGGYLQVILQEEHLHDLLERLCLVCAEIRAIIGGSERKLSQRNRTAGFKKWEDGETEVSSR